MEYINKDQGAYHLHIVKTDAFKTVTVKVFFREPVQKENITKRNFLASILLLSTKDYQSKSILTKALQNLYAANIRYGCRRLGNYLDTSFSLRVLHDRYTETGNFSQAIELLESVIFHPNVIDNAFNDRDFKAIYEEYKADLESMKDDKRSYAMIRLLEETNPSLPNSFRGIGYLEDLEKITPENLYAYYQEMLAHNLVDIYVLGDVDEEEITALFREHFPIKTFKSLKMPTLLEEVASSKAKTVRESIQASQTQIAISLSCNHLSSYERNYPLSIYNTILGGGVDSLLFKEVREEKSLAYTIGSSPNKLDHLILISGGITKGCEEEVISIVKKKLKQLAKGAFDEEMLTSAKEYYLSALDDIMESSFQLIESYYMIELLGVDDIETKRKKMQEVTKADVIAVASKIKLNTIFVLEGEDDGKNSD